MFGKISKWEELLSALMKLASSSESSHREAFLIVLDRLAEFALDVLRKDMNNVRTMLVGALKDKAASVRTAALRAVVSLLLSLDKNDELKYFSDLIPLLFQNIAQTAGDEVVTKACENLHHLVENRPEFFAQYMKPIVDCLSKCVAGNQLTFVILIQKNLFGVLKENKKMFVTQIEKKKKKMLTKQKIWKSNT
ncbi:hypothetical protein RFI_40339 [Reticulomyxa filosa]|uniref:IPO4/5-like TPR repeats domain-containing protein n=1 Tax=Reticulomyxa filosa TaxID=46433 RepID=X6L832_RETFI|nr:hypothetical protein RFI_40339 [Reticulomyxa filosa]|eukprot:ETN97191.1 hypothetical protein RFI_40339 [Reticulomyxa filosa]